MSGSTWCGGAVLCLAAVVAPVAQAADKQVIDQAIRRGVVYLKQGQMGDGSWPHGHPGATALAALTFLECGVPANDPAVQRAAAYLRNASVTLTHTYSLSLCNMFFDRLGDPADVPLIESITVRLLRGQSNHGGWTYLCPENKEEEVRRLTAHLNRPVQQAVPKAAPRRTANDLPKEIKDQLGRLVVRQADVPAGVGADQARLLARDDNSNTQFAIMGLWVSRRHGLPVDSALAKAEHHFRSSQNNNGGWGYLSSPAAVRGMATESAPAMTCAGLLGLAMGYGATGEAVLHTAPGKPVSPGKAGTRNVQKDRAVRIGLGLLATAIGQPRGSVDYYYLWSLERVAMVYDLKTIGKKDWYGWGAGLLLEHQQEAGSWNGKYGSVADTCFALLFLCRSNLAQDLTAALRGKLGDTAELRAGGFAKEPDKAASGASSVKPAAGSVPAVPPVRNDAAPVPPKPLEPVKAPPLSDGVQRLTDALVRAPASRRDTVLTELVESKGAQYTEALAAAIPQLSGEAKQKARDGLVKRLARMTAATLRDKFKDGNVEVRRAAALAVELKGDRQLIPDLIALLEDAVPTVVRAAHAALKEMTGQDHGPPAPATAAERSQAAARWKAWWAKQKP